MSLGLSKDDTETKFNSADAVVAGVDSNGKGYAVDYFFQSNEKCNNGQGMCPDYIYGTSDDLKLIEVGRNENFATVMFKRRLRAADDIYDQNIYTDGPQAILWAVGSTDSNGFPELPRLKSKGNLLLDFGREPNWNCPPPKSNLHSAQPKEKNQYIHCPSDRTFRAQIGTSPRSNVKKVWFINGLPTPQLTVQRGNTYTFIIEGGLNPPFHHPFYITNSERGGMYQNILDATDPEEFSFAGVQQDPRTGNIYPTAEGRLCMWTYSDMDMEYSIINSDMDIKSTLTLKCEPGEPGKLIWTPNNKTPDVVYYQSFKERNLGGVIKIVDFCEESTPHHYLQTSLKEENPKQYTENGEKKKIESEREVEDDFTLFSNIKHEKNINAEENVEYIPKDFTHNLQAESTKYIGSQKYMHSVKGSPVIEENINTENFEHYSAKNETTSPSIPTSESIYRETLFPHDESERSDVYLPNHGNSKKHDLNKHLNSNANREALETKRPVSSIAASSVNAPMIQSFQPQFEGGFVPLVMNPTKKDEFSETKALAYIYQQRRRPHKPFLYNESIPFHGTFKPGVPDFSGFNISHYSQEDASVLIGSNQDDLFLLQASKPQLIREPFPQVGAIPFRLLQRSQYQQPPQKNQGNFNSHHSSIPPFGIRQNGFPSIHISRKPNNPISNIRDEDLAGLSSQRIYTALQASGEKIPHIGASSTSTQKQQPLTFNRKQTHQNHQLNRIIYPPPIQRRPDLYEIRDVNLQQSKTISLNYNPQISLLNVRQKPQKMNLPALQPTPVGKHSNVRPSKQSFSLTQDGKITYFPNDKKNMGLPPEQLRSPYPLQPTIKDRIPNMAPLMPKVPIHMHSSSNGDINVRNVLLGRLYGTTDKLNLPPSFGQIPEHLHNLGPIKPDLQQSPKENYNTQFSINSDFDWLMQQTQPFKSPVVQTDLQTTHNIHMKDVPNFNEAGIENLNINTKFHTNSVRKDSSSENISNTPITVDITLDNNTSASNEMMSIKLQHHFTSPATISTPKNISHSSSGNSSVVEQQTTYETIESLENEDDTGGKSQVKGTSSENVPVFSTSKPVEINNISHLTNNEHKSFESETNNSYELHDDYLNYNLPFGSRLKSSSNPKILGKNENLRIPGVVFRKSPTNTEQPESKTTQFTQMTTSTSNESYISIANTTSFTSYSGTEHLFKPEAESTKKLYYTPPLQNPNFLQRNKTNNINPFSYEIKHIPIIADTLEGFDETKYLQRKQIFSDNSSSLPNKSETDSKILEDVNPAVNDNRTNYSILNHVLTLIGNSPDSNET